MFPVMSNILFFHYVSFKIAGTGYNDHLTGRYSNQSQLLTSSRTQFGSTEFGLSDQQVNNSQQIQNARYDNRAALALGPPQSSSSSSYQTAGTSVQQSNMNPFDDWSQSRDKGVEEFLSEEEIRIRSHEMLENEDMQHLLRLFSMGGHGGGNIPDDGFSFPSYIPSPSQNFGYDEDRTRSGKAVVGWLKIKAAMRWGFFIRKKAAERRAQIVELEDE